MPNRKAHSDLSKILLGTSGNDIHKFLDAPVKWLGRNHRESRHDSHTVALIYATKGAEAAEHALTHILLDKSVSLAKKVAGELINDGVKKVLSNIKRIKGVI